MSKVSKLAAFNASLPRIVIQVLGKYLILGYVALRVHPNHPDSLRCFFTQRRLMAFDAAGGIGDVRARRWALGPAIDIERTGLDLGAEV